MAWADIPNEAYALIGAGLGGGISVATTYLIQRGQRRLQREQLREARKAALLKELGIRFQAIATDFSAAAHSMCWLTWQAAHGGVSQKMLDDYHAEMHAILPRLIGGKIMISALDPAVGDQLELFVDLAHEVEEEIAAACATYANDEAAGREQLKALNLKARDLDEIIYRKLADVGSGKSHTRLMRWMTRKWAAGRRAGRPRRAAIVEHKS
ncbi:MAG TPA: hypothetical protein VGF60_13625 [Xanthobacteraceae bacterium]|jgi:hypothetical protein